MADHLHVTQIRSSIGTKPKHRGTLRALGLRRLGQSNTLPDRPEIRGMIARVPHLVSVVRVPAGGDLEASRQETEETHESS
jgi:large subunit ribosomal protein L30